MSDSGKAVYRSQFQSLEPCQLAIQIGLHGFSMRRRYPYSLHSSLTIDISRPLIASKLKSLPLLKAAYDRGLNTWDTANVYSNGVSEEIIGKAIKQFDIPRHKLVILNKCFGIVGEQPGLRITYPQEMDRSKDYVNQGGE